MDSQQLAGRALIVMSVLTWLAGVGDTISDLQNWHAAATPQIVGVLLKQAAMLGSAVIGGKMLPTFKKEA